MFGIWLKIRRSVPLLALYDWLSITSIVLGTEQSVATDCWLLSTINSPQLHACVHAAALHVGHGPSAVPAYHTSLLLLCRGWLVLAGCGGAPEPCGHTSKVCYSAEPKFGACPGLSLCRWPCTTQILQCCVQDTSRKCPAAAEHHLSEGAVG